MKKPCNALDVILARLLRQRKDGTVDWWWMAGNSQRDKGMRSDLIARYADERLPRYTSYPTAPHFTADIGPDVYGDWLAALPAHAVGSLYVHVPFCRRMCWYCGCNTAVSQRDEPIAAYMGSLSDEIAMVSARIGRPLDVAHLHFGGGTPTIVGPDDFRRVMDTIRQAFALRDDAEIAIEIDPRTLTAAMAEALGAGGVTRASLGVQTLDPDVQAAINRRQGFDRTREAIDRLRAAGIAAINIDLIYGLPRQTRRILHRDRRCVPFPAAGSLLGLRLCPCPRLQEASAQDRRRRPSRRP